MGWLNFTDCDQYSLTKEQMEQKAEKKQRAKAYSVIKPFSGKWLPLQFGWKVLCTPPCNDEYRLPLVIGDFVTVTRWRKNWLFGEKTIGQGEESSKKGWFPRCCVIEINGEKSKNEENKKEL